MTDIVLNWLATFAGTLVVAADRRVFDTSPPGPGGSLMSFFAMAK